LCPGVHGRKRARRCSKKAPSSLSSMWSGAYCSDVAVHACRGST
jgi:hypothetical protein